MAALTTAVAAAVAETYDFSDVATVVDVGGGQGVLLEAVLARHPHLTGTVFDLEQAVADAPARRRAGSALVRPRPAASSRRCRRPTPTW